MPETHLHKPGISLALSQVVEKKPPIIAPPPVPDLVTSMCFCKIEKPDHDEELMPRDRPRQQASQRMSLQFGSEYNLSTFPPR